MKNNLLKYFKIIFYNFLVFILLIFIIEIFFGNWFKNNFNLKMSSERNIKRLYKYNFDNHKGIVKYERDNFGFRTNKKIEPENIDIVFIGGSTANQKFISYDKTIVSLLQNKFSSAKNKKTVVNAGVDGMSSIGHINSFPMWFDKISNFKPKYYIFYIGINDLKIFNDYKIEGTDLLEEGTLKKIFKNTLSQIPSYTTN